MTQQLTPVDNHLFGCFLYLCIMKVVYVISNHITGFTKIGVTNNIDRRIRSLSSASGVRLRCEYTSPPSENAMEVEAIAHNHFKGHRTIGEWFKIKPLKAIMFLQACDFKVDPLYGHLQKNNIIGTAKKFGISRQAVQQKLIGWGKTKENDTRQVKKSGSWLSPMFKRVEKNIYNKRGVFVAREYQDGVFIDTEWASLDEARKHRDGAKTN